MLGSFPTVEYGLDLERTGAKNVVQILALLFQERHDQYAQKRHEVSSHTMR
jgi:hypothetical protein